LGGGTLSSAVPMPAFDSSRALSCPDAGERESPYTLVANHEGRDFLHGWGFWSAADPQQGLVNYRNKEDAARLNYTFYDEGADAFILQPDSTSRLGEWENRDSVRIETTSLYKYGLVVLDAEHMPAGCGLWPAFWMYDFPWPVAGEIDIIEGVHNSTENRVALHTTSKCAMKWEPSTFTGTMDKNLYGAPGANCDVKAEDQKPNVGCGIKDFTYGEGFNQGGGGVYAMEWTSDGISVWFFPRRHIPRDLHCKNPQPTKWGQPMARFEFGAHCDKSSFDFQHIVINLTFCGVWGERDFAAWGCQHQGLTCQEFVRQKPEALKEAYWKIRNVRVYQTPEGLVDPNGKVGPHDM